MDDDLDRTADADAGVTDVLAPQERRRFARYGESIPVASLVDQSLRSAELQLLEARESLKDARRRVVQLEDALKGWQALRDALAPAAAGTSRAAAS
jgi:hypothetical protein